MFSLISIIIVCIRNYLVYRHNIHAPLAVAIAALKPNIQVIKVAEYRIHPKHVTNPYDQNYAKHNLGILSLACKIDVENYYKIELPKKPTAQICIEEDCIVPIYRLVGYVSTVV